MVKFILFASRLELFTKEIAYIQSQLIAYNSEIAITDNTFKFISLIANSRKEENVAILFASSDDELQQFLDLKKHLCPIPTILVLPDDHIETLQKGMLLSPLYFMAKHAEFNQFSVAINELCHIYEDYDAHLPQRSYPDVYSNS